MAAPDAGLAERRERRSAGTDPRPGSTASRKPRARPPAWLLALIFYFAFALLTIGWHALLHPQTVCACDGGGDPSQYMWSLAWWPHALAHGLNPFVTHYLWSPTGVNLTEAATVPTAALAMAPVTAVFGEVFSYNAVAIASPALSAFTAYLLCRRLVKRELPAVAGGFLFGFSSYEFAQLVGHMNLVTVFLIPLMVLVTLKRADRELSRRAYVLTMALLFALQLGLSTEILAECVMLGAVLLVAARLLAGEPHRARINGLMLEVLGAGLVAVIVTSPFLYHALISGKPPPGNQGASNIYGLDVVNLVFPTLTTWLGHHDFQSLSFTLENGDVSETDGYFGFAILTAFSIWFFTAGKRTLLGRLAAITVVLSVFLALGSYLHVAGHPTMSLPYRWINELPIFNIIIPSRLVLYASLAIAIGIAAWLAEPGGRPVARWALVVVGAVMIFPYLSPVLYGTPMRNPRFFSTGLYRRYLAPNENVLVLPYGVNDVSTLWQSETGFYFYMPEGYVSGQIPTQFQRQRGVLKMVDNVPPGSATLEHFIRAHHVKNVVVDPVAAGPWPAALSRLGLHARSVGGVLLYSVPGSQSL